MSRRWRQGPRFAQETGPHRSHRGRPDWYRRRRSPERHSSGPRRTGRPGSHPRGRTRRWSWDRGRSRRSHQFRDRCATPSSPARQSTTRPRPSGVKSAPGESPSVTARSSTRRWRSRASRSATLPSGNSATSEGALSNDDRVRRSASSGSRSRTPIAEAANSRASEIVAWRSAFSLLFNSELLVLLGDLGLPLRLVPPCLCLVGFVDRDGRGSRGGHREQQHDADGAQSCSARAPVLADLFGFELVLRDARIAEAISAMAAEKRGLLRSSCSSVRANRRSTLAAQRKRALWRAGGTASPVTSPFAQRSRHR